MAQTGDGVHRSSDVRETRGDEPYSGRATTAASAASGIGDEPYEVGRSLTPSSWSRVEASGAVRAFTEPCCLCRSRDREWGREWQWDRQWDGCRYGFETFPGPHLALGSFHSVILFLFFDNDEASSSPQSSAILPDLTPRIIAFFFLFFAVKSVPPGPRFFPQTGEGCLFFRDTAKPDGGGGRQHQEVGPATTHLEEEDPGRSFRSLSPPPALTVLGMVGSVSPSFFEEQRDRQTIYTFPNAVDAYAAVHEP